MKRVILFVLSTIMCLNMFFIGNLNAVSSAPVFSYNSNMEITSIKNINNSVLSLPEEAVGFAPEFNITDISQAELVETISIPKNFTVLNSNAIYKKFPNLKEFIVNKENNNFTSENGVLFSKNKTVLYIYPENKPDYEYTIPENTLIINSYAFANNQHIGKVNISKDVTTIKESCFYNSSVKEVYMSDSVETIGNECFKECATLEKIELSENLTSIGNECFKDCVTLEEINIPKSVKELGTGVFYGCTSLKKAALPASLKSIPAYTFMMSGITTAEMPSSAASIGDYAFACCNLESSLIIPEGVESIGQYAFAYCNIKEFITFPKSLKSIKEGAFVGNIDIFYIIFNGTETKFNLEAIYTGNNFYDMNIYCITDSNTYNCLKDYHEYLYIKDINDFISFEDLSDIPEDHWAKEAIKFCFYKNYMKGKSSSSFDPNAKITRAEFSQLMFNMNKRSFDPDDIYFVEDFTDVPYDKWYSEAIYSCSAMGLIAGYDDCSFKPNNNIIRQDAILVIMRNIRGYYYYEFIDPYEIENMIEILNQDNIYKDINNISDYAKAAVIDALYYNYISGSDDGYVNPKNNLTRAECAQLIYNIYKNRYYY